MSEKTGKKETKEKPNIYVEITAEQKGIPYEKAQKEMDKVYKKYGINYREYAEHKLFSFKRRRDYREKIKNIMLQNQRYVNYICSDTGWSYEKAEAAARAAKEKYGFSYRTYSTYRFFECSEEEIEAKREQWKENRKKYRKIVKENTGWKLHDVIRHMRRYSVLYNIIPAYYVLYRAWELSDEEMDTYARQEISRDLWVKYNTREDAHVLADKLLFDQMYRDYIGRKFWVNVDTDFDEFRAFTEGLDSIFCKPVLAGGGLGTSKIDLDHNEEKLRALYDDFMSRDRILVEECVKQHPEMDEFIPGCVNTIRVVILLKDGVSHVICTGVRFGHSGITDNFSHDGMVCDVDRDTGIIVTPAIDKKGNIYEKHPVSGKKFVGFQIPMWDEVLKTADAAIRVQDGVNYAGWDLAICEDRVVIIEGNSMPDLVLVQAPYAPKKEGKKYLFEPYL
ncbi:MAG: sugar-transfer associated ATP-grasp domain-containing protein [Emergencia sp.]